MESFYYNAKILAILKILLTLSSTAKALDDMLGSGSNFSVILYESSAGRGRNQVISVNTTNYCTPVPPNWQNSVGAIGLEKYCVRLWQDEQCDMGKVSRCHCDSRFLSLDDHFRLSKEFSWKGRVNGLSPCLEQDNRRGDVSIAWLFSEENFRGNLTTVVLQQVGGDGEGECWSYPEGDKWHGGGRSSWLFQGCVQFFEEENCAGESLALSKANVSGNFGKIKSVRNCAGDKEIVEGKLALQSDNGKHEVGVLIYPKGFADGLPWANNNN